MGAAAVPLATLSIDLVAKLAELTTSLAQGVSQVEGAAAKMRAAFDTVKLAAAGIVGGLVSGLSVVGFARLISGAIESAASLKELSERTQSSVEGLSAISAVAKLSGVDIESVGTALQKLAKSQVDAIDGGKKTGEAFRSIGISVKDLVGLKPDEVFLLIAKQLGGFADGSEKAAVAQALLGKAGANQLGVLADLGIAGAYQVKVTTGQAEQALEYEKNLKRLEATQRSIFKTIGLELAPVLNAFAKALLGAANEAGGLRGEIKELADDGSIESWAKTAVRVVAIVGDAFQGVTRVIQLVGTYLGATVAAVDTVLNSNLKQVSGRLASLRAEVSADLAKIAEAPLFSARLEAQLALVGSTKKEAARPEINFRANTATGANGPDPAKAALDAQLKTLDGQIKSEQALLAFRNKVLDLLNKEGLTTFAEYYAERQRIADNALAVEQTNIDKELSLLRARLKKVAGTPEAESDQGKIDALLERRQRLTTETALRNIESISEQRLAYVAYGKEILGVEAEVLTTQQHIAQAAAIRFDSQHDALTQRFSIEGNLQALAALHTLRDYTIAQARFSEVSTSAAQTQESLSLAEGRIQLLQETGALSSIAALVAVGNARRESIKLQEAQVAAEEAIAKAAGNPSLILAAEKSRLALEQLKATIDPIADKINQSLATSFESAFAGFITGTQSASQAFKAFAASVIAEIGKIIAQQLAAKLFGGGAGGGGVGSFLSLLFGAGGAATGGGVGAGEIKRVGENGPETFNVQGKTYLLSGQAGTVSPAGGGGGGTNVVVNIASGVSRNELAALVPQLTQSIKAQIRDDQHRPGGGY